MLLVDTETAETADRNRFQGNYATTLKNSAVPPKSFRLLCGLCGLCVYKQHDVSVFWMGVTTCCVTRPIPETSF